MATRPTSCQLDPEIKRRLEQQAARDPYIGPHWP
jgi:hypothetical protein